MRLAAILTIATMILAGCAESAPVVEDEPVAPIHSEPVQATPTKNIMATATSERTHLLRISPSAPVAGFVIDIPDDSAYAAFPGSSFSYVDVAFAPVFDTPPQGLGVFYFDMLSGALIGGHLMVPVQGTQWLTAALPTPFDQAAVLAPWVASLPGEMEGGSVGIVVAGNGVTQNLSVAMHVANGELDWFNPLSAETILSKAPDAPQPHGTGTGFEVELYTELHLGLLGTPGLLGLVATAGNPTVDERLQTWAPPHGGVRDATVTADTAIESGWSYASTGHLAAEGVTQWYHSVEASGASAADDGTLAWVGSYGLLGSALVFGLPIGTAAGDGPGASAATVEVQAATNNEVYLLLAETIAFDQSLAALLGVRATPTTNLFEGLLSIDTATGIMTMGGEAPITHSGFIAADPSP